MRTIFNAMEKIAVGGYNEITMLLFSSYNFIEVLLRIFSFHLLRKRTYNCTAFESVLFLIPFHRLYNMFRNLIIEIYSDDLRF